MDYHFYPYFLTYSFWLSFLFDTGSLPVGRSRRKSYDLIQVISIWIQKSVSQVLMLWCEDVLLVYWFSGSQKDCYLVRLLKRYSIAKVWWINWFSVSHKDSYLLLPVKIYSGNCLKRLVTREQITLYWHSVLDISFSPFFCSFFLLFPPFLSLCFVPSLLISLNKI